MNTLFLSLALFASSVAGPVTDCIPCDPKHDPGCRFALVAIAPVADPISTANAGPVKRIPCDPKTDPSCDN